MHQCASGLLRWFKWRAYAQDNPPELKAVKTKHNRSVMKKMQDLFKEGGKLIWVAPSGGRDRAGKRSA